MNIVARWVNIGVRISQFPVRSLVNNHRVGFCRIVLPIPGVVSTLASFGNYEFHWRLSDSGNRTALLETEQSSKVHETERLLEEARA